MKIRIISDLHLDVNADYPLELTDKQAFTIICGDISGDFAKATTWLDDNVQNGVFVAGNHLIYNNSSHSLQFLAAQYQKRYPLTASLSFLQDEFKIIDDVVFVGGTLWTDYALFGAAQKEMSMWLATRHLNDFYFGKYNPTGSAENENTEDLLPLKPKHCAAMFTAAITKIDEVCQRFPDKKIVVITHHAPSLDSVPPKYQNSVLTPSYASNLEDFIKARPNIKLWCHGHIHALSDYQIGQCRVVCNPRGYVSAHENPAFDENYTLDI